MPEWKRELRARLAGLRLQPAREVEIVEELSLHLDDRFEELRAGGAGADDARRLALAELADHELLRREMRWLRQSSAPDPVTPGAAGLRLASDLWHDLRYAVRMLRKRPGFTAAAVLTLALGTGANTAIFSLVNATLLQQLPVRDPARLLYVHNGAPGLAFAYPEYTDLRDGNAVFDGLIAWGGITATLAGRGDTDLVGGAIVSGNFFEVLGVTAALGRTLTPADDLTPGAHPVVVVSHGLWQRHFGGRTDVIGQELRLNGLVFTVVGVMPPAFGGAQMGIVRDIYVPMMMQAIVRPPRAGYSGERNPDLLNVRGNRWLYMIGRITSGISAEGAAASLSRAATAFDRARQADSPDHRIVTTPVSEGDPRERVQMVQVARLLMAVVAAVLLIACANVANLLLSRASARRREIAVRLALGASRSRLVRQLLTESVLIGLAGGAAGLALAVWIVHLLRAAPPPAGSLPLALDFSIDWRVLVFALGVSLATGVLFGLAPALWASRPGLAPALKDDAIVADEHGRRVNVRKVLVIAQVALSLLLLMAAGLFIQSLRAAYAIDPGFRADRLVTAPLNVNLLRYTTAQGREFYGRVVEQVEVVPGVESASVARIALLSGASRIVSIQIEGHSGSDLQLRSEGGGVPANTADTASANVIGPKFFRTLGIALLTGRDFNAQDAGDAPAVAIISETFARVYLGTDEPIGKRLSVDGPRGPWRHIVGVVRDAKYATLGEAPTPLVFLPLQQNHETGMTLYVRSSVDPAGLVGAVRAAIQSVEKNLPVTAVQPVVDTIGSSLYPARMGAILLAVFGGLALLLAGVGVYGVMAFSVSRRTRELGIRVALGARPRDVLSLVLREALTLVAAGMAIGLVAAAFGARSLATFLYGISTIDAVTFAIVPAVLAGVALAACYLPARRAMTVDPVGALKER